jgi:integrase
MATVEQFIDARYRPDHISRKRKGTRKDYESIIRVHILPSIGHCQLRDVTRAMVQVIVNTKDKSGLSGERVRHVRNVISSIFRHARRMNYLAGELPTVDVILPERNAEKRRPLNDEQIELLLLHVKEPRLRYAIRLMARHGLRAGEMAGLRWESVNLTEEPVWMTAGPLGPRQIWIHEQYTRNEFAPCKTKESNRRIELTNEMVAMLTEWRAVSRFTAATDTVFAAKNGKPMDTHNVLNRTLKPAMIKAGLPWASWHHLRHTAATNASTVMSPFESAAMLGHSSIRVTSGYTHISPSVIREKLESLPVRGPKN